MSERYPSAPRTGRLTIDSTRHVNVLGADRNFVVFTAWDRGMVKPGLYADETAAIAAFDVKDHDLLDLQQRKSAWSEGRMPHCLLTVADIRGSVAATEAKIT